MATKRFERSSANWWAFAIMLVTVALLVSMALGVWNTLPTLPQTSSAAGATTWSAATQTDARGQVTIEATLQESGAGPVFNVVMDTHAVDLDSYDLVQLAVLRTEQGTSVQPTGWDAPKGGHHREGTLTFPTTAADGTPVLGPDIRSIELVIRNVADVPERTFTWTR